MLIWNIKEALRMNYSISYFTLDINDAVSQVSLRVKKIDTNKKLKVLLTENGRPFKIGEGCTVVFSGRKADGTVIYNDCEVKNNTIEYVLSPQVLAAGGIVECEFLVYGGDSQVTCSSKFLIEVYETTYDIDHIVESTNEFSALTKAMSRLETATDEAEEALEVAKKSIPRKITVTLYASAWADTDADGIYTQEIVVSNATENTQVDLTPSEEQMAIFANKDLTFIVANESGKIIVSAIGDRPTNDYTMQATATEVIYESTTEEETSNG